MILGEMGLIPGFLASPALVAPHESLAIDFSGVRISTILWWGHPLLALGIIVSILALWLGAVLDQTVVRAASEAFVFSFATVVSAAVASAATVFSAPSWMSLHL